MRWASPREMKKVGFKKVPWGAYIHGSPSIILIDNEIQRRNWGKTRDETLHHEMIHLSFKGRGNHGRVFKKRELRRLMAAGAFDNIF